MQLIRPVLAAVLALCSGCVARVPGPTLAWSPRFAGVASGVPAEARTEVRRGVMYVGLRLDGGAAGYANLTAPVLVRFHVVGDGPGSLVVVPAQSGPRGELVPALPPGLAAARSATRRVGRRPIPGDIVLTTMDAYHDSLMLPCRVSLVLVGKDLSVHDLGCRADSGESMRFEGVLTAQ